MKKWTKYFLGASAVAVLMELWASFDKDPETQSWTLLIVRNVPVWIGLPAIMAFAVWLVYHFNKYYKENKNGRTN